MYRYFAILVVLASWVIAPENHAFAQPAPNNPCNPNWTAYSVTTPPSLSAPTILNSPNGVSLVGKSMTFTAKDGVPTSGQATRTDQNNCDPAQTMSVTITGVTTKWTVSGVSASPSSGTGDVATFTPSTAGAATVTFTSSGTSSFDQSTVSSQGATSTAKIIEIQLPTSLSDTAVGETTTGKVTIVNPSGANVTVEVDVSSDSANFSDNNTTEFISSTQTETIQGTSPSQSVGGSTLTAKFNNETVATATFTVFTINLPSVGSIQVNNTFSGQVTYSPSGYSAQAVLAISPTTSNTATFDNGTTNEDISSDGSITINGNSVGEATLSVTVGSQQLDSSDIEVTNSSPSVISFDLQDTAGPKYRKIALNGSVLPDEKPQATQETDEDKEETFVDAFTDTLHHSVTDVYVPLPGGLLALSARRNVTTEIWGDVSGLNPEDQTNPRPDRPFGYCWTSNLTPNVEIVTTSWAGTLPSPDIPIPTVTVTDENGDPHRFREVQGSGNSTVYYPYPQSYEEKDEYLNSLVASSDGTLTFRKKYATTMVFAPTNITYIDIVSKATNGSLIASHVFYQARYVSDRFGNKLDYTYSNANSLIPTQITYDGHPSQNIQIFTDANNHITTITDPNGHNHSYNYSTQPAPDSNNWTGTIYALYAVQGPVNASGVNPTTYYGYDYNGFAAEPDQQPTFVGDTAVKDDKYHVDLNSIEDPNGKTYGLQYVIDTSIRASKLDPNFPSPRSYQANGYPKLVANITLPDGLGQTTISKIGLEQVSGVSVFADPRSILVVDAAGNARIYSFTDYQLITLQNFEYGTQPQESLLASYGTTTISYFQGSGVSVPPVNSSSLLPPATPLPYTISGNTQLMGTEKFSFDLASGLALSKVVDFSGNATVYEHADPWTISQNDPSYAAVTSVSFPFGYFSDPTSEVDARGNPKTFSYQSYGQYAANRVMYKMIDRDGRETKNGIDPTYGRRLNEIIYTDSTETTPVQETDYTYDTTFLGFVRSKIVRNLGKPTDTPDLETDYVPDSLGRVYQQIVDPNGLHLVTTYSYDLNNNKLTEQDPRGYTTTFHYDNLNQLIEIDYPPTNGGAGASKTFTYDPRGNKIKEVDENGNVTNFTYDGLNRLVQQERVMAGGTNLVTKYSYNGVNSKTSETDPNNNTTYMSYDGLQRLISTLDALNQTTSYQYGANSGGNTFDVSSFKPTQITDPRGYVTNMSYDTVYRLTVKSIQYQLSPPLFSTTLMYYDNEGNMTSSVDPEMNTTMMAYDALNRVTQVTFDDQSTQATTYSSTGLKVQTLDELSSVDPHRVTNYSYDGAGRLTDVIGGTVNNGSGVLARPDTHTVYDADGNVSATINPLGNEWDYTFDPRNRKLTETEPAVSYQGTSVRPQLAWTYDNVGNILTEEDAQGNVTTYSYDSDNRKTDVLQPSVTLPGGGAVQPHTHTTYDSDGNIVQTTDANNNSTNNQYDALNRLTSSTDAAGIQVIYGYDAVGNRTSVEDGLQQTTRFSYDGLNRNTGTTDAAGKTTTFNYDGLNKISRVDALGQETDYAYNNRNRLIYVSYQGRSNDDRTYAYDAVGNLLSVSESGETAAYVAYSYDALNRAITETSNGLTHAYTLDLAGNRLQTVYGGTNRTITSVYDALNRLTSMAESGRTTSYAYDQNGNILQKTAPNGDAEAYQYDALNRATSEAAQTGAAVSLFGYQYGYDAVGNVLLVTETYPSGLGNRVVSNSYDPINRLLQEAVTGANAATTVYTYDKANNRLSKVITGAGATSVNYTYNNLNQLTGYSDTAGRAVMLGYDLDGNRINRTVIGGSDSGQDSYGYDYENRLVSLVKATGSGSGAYAYAYDYRTRRVTRDESGAGGAVTGLVFSGGTSVQEYDNGATTPTVEYIRGSDYGGGVGGILYTLRGGVPSYTHENRRGDVVAKTDGTGSLTYQAQYEGFGQQVATTGNTLDRQKSNSKDTDPTGLVDEGFRYRDLETGMFITRDPMGFVDGPNLYTYVVQNPWTKFDPEGLYYAEMYAGYGAVAGGVSAAGISVVVDYGTVGINIAGTPAEIAGGTAAGGGIGYGIGRVLDQMTGHAGPTPTTVGGGFTQAPPIDKNEGFSQAPPLPTTESIPQAAPKPTSLPGGDTKPVETPTSTPPQSNPEQTQQNTVLQNQSASSTNEHHSDPKFMGGDPNQPTTTMPQQQHQDLHQDLNKFLKGKTDGQGNDMSPRSNNSGAQIRQNFTQQQRDDAMSEFYQQHGTKYPQAAKDYFAQKPLPPSPPPPPPPPAQ